MSMDANNPEAAAAQYFFEIGFMAAWAEAAVRYKRAPFPLTDRILEKAWATAREGVDDPAEWDAHLAHDCDIERLRADAARLDFLDRCNRRLNSQCGTNYRWELILNHNVNRLMLGDLQVDLNDSAANGLSSCREAIDAAMSRCGASISTLSEVSNPAAGEDAGNPYLSDRFEWAAPGDQQKDAWLVRFCDNDVRDTVYTGPDAETEARAAWERHAPGYNMYLFRLAKLAPPGGDAVHVPAEPSALAASIAELEAFERDGTLLDEIKNWASFGESVMLCLHELKRLRAGAGEDFLAQLRRVNGERYAAWTGDGVEDPLYLSNEFGGEAGEIQNVVKKLVREQRGWRGSRATVEQMADEIADGLICLDNLARGYGIDLAEAVARKFNETSDKNCFPHKLSRSSPAVVQP